MRKHIIKGKREQNRIRITLALPILYIWHIIITLQCIAGAKHKSINQSLLINKRYNWMISIDNSLLQSEKHIIKGKREQNRIRITLALRILYIWHIIITLCIYKAFRFFYWQHGRSYITEGFSVCWKKKGLKIPQE